MSTDTSSWNAVYKYKSYGMENTETNMIYTPLVNNENNVLCMWFDHTSPYQTTDLEWWLPSRPDFTKELVDYVFQREVRYLSIFKDRNWAPNVIDINLDQKKIFIEWSGETLNHIIYSGRDINKILPDWRKQMTGILKDINGSGYYKASLYPHCYYIQNGVLKTIDFYAVAEKEYPYMHFSDIKGLIGENSGHRFKEATEGDKLNLGTFSKRAMSTHVKWPNDATALSDIYTEVFTTT